MTNEEKKQKFAPGCVDGLDYKYVKWYQMSNSEFWRPIIVFALMVPLVPLSIIGLCIYKLYAIPGVLVCNSIWILIFLLSHRKAVREAIEFNKRLSNNYIRIQKIKEREAEKLDLLRKIAENQDKKS